MADALIEAQIKEHRSSNALSFKFGICSLLIVVLVMVAALVGSFYVFRIMENKMPYPECQIIRLDDSSDYTVANKNTGNGDDSFSDVITSSPPIITISLIKNRERSTDTVTPEKAKQESASTLAQPSTNQMELVSADNLVKLSVIGSFILHDIAQNIRYKLQIGPEGMVTHRLRDLIPSVEVSFKCGKITMYLNEDINDVTYVTMMTGELANGVDPGQECFYWRTKASGLIFPNHCLNETSHYYCNRLDPFHLTVHQQAEAFKLSMKLDLLELELNRKPTSPEDKYITPRGNFKLQPTHDSMIPLS